MLANTRLQCPHCQANGSAERCIFVQEHKCIRCDQSGKGCNPRCISLGPTEWILPRAAAAKTTTTTTKTATKNAPKTRASKRKLPKSDEFVVDDDDESQVAAPPLKKRELQVGGVRFAADIDGKGSESSSSR